MSRSRAAARQSSFSDAGGAASNVKHRSEARDLLFMQSPPVDPPRIELEEENGRKDDDDLIQ